MDPYREVFCAELRMFITAGRDGAVKVWRVRGPTPKQWTTQLVQTIGDSTMDKPVVSMAPMMGDAALLTATSEGVVQLWSLETFEPVHKMRVSGGMHHMVGRCKLTPGLCS